ncbi:uncharacterized protein LOC120178871 [Hibiscus syriacus]|uniref:uncharacterized protein LOC120178871 n=1 Tax=Hibiscus syriacus TaxID=106335 RepID=UPI001921FFB8|nr:uncharacterized protein LOC120178871 [Hibiscus syriacus]
MRALIWIKAINENVPMVEADWWNTLAECFSLKPPLVSWCPPSEGCLKFNVDGAFKDPSAGCGGVLRNSKGDTKALFSAPVDPINSDYSELMAIKTVLALFLETGWCENFSLSIESDSQLVLKWIESSSERPWRWRDIFEEIDSYLKRIEGVKFVYVPREGNGFADHLAKQRLLCSMLFKAWWD